MLFCADPGATSWSHRNQVVTECSRVSGGKCPGQALSGLARKLYTMPKLGLMDTKSISKERIRTIEADVEPMHVEEAIQSEAHCHLEHAISICKAHQTKSPKQCESNTSDFHSHPKARRNQGVRPYTITANSSGPAGEAACTLCCIF